MTLINFNQARYLLAAHYPQQWPPDRGAEVAFAGRSNVGKSSAINIITRHKGLAKTSKTPGRTRQIIFFQLANDYRLVDLPGYGYARAPKPLRQHWQTLMTEYLMARRSLRGVIIPMDIRHPLTELDTRMLEYCWQLELAVHVLLTKADKLSTSRARNTWQQIKGQLVVQPHTTVQLFSALKNHGVDCAQEKLTELLQAGSEVTMD